MDGGVLRRAGRRAQPTAARSPRSSRTSVPTSPARLTDEDIDAAVGRMRALLDPVTRSATRCSTSGWPAASATSTRARCCSPVASTRSRPVEDLDVDTRRRLLDTASTAPAPQRERRVVRGPRYARASPCTAGPVNRVAGAARPSRRKRQGEHARTTYWCPNASEHRDDEGGRRRRRLRWADRGEAPREGWRRRHPRRPAQLPHLPAAALPSGHRWAERRRRRLRGARHLPAAAQRDVPPRDVTGVDWARHTLELDGGAKHRCRSTTS